MIKSPFKNFKTSILIAIALIFGASTFLLSQTIPAYADANFQKWIGNFKSVAARNGIRRDVYNHAFKNVRSPDADVLKKARFQPEFKSKIWDYLDSRVNPYTVRIGREMAIKHNSTLSAVEQKFGVSRNIILAIWSMETNYGAVLEKTDRLHYIPRALATLGYADKRRRKFARKQLLAALKIYQRGDIKKSQFSGSWAGAMGHTQFIPTSYLAYGVDFDRNGKRDIWNSIPDALATAANLLKRNGWKNGYTWGYEVKAPAHLAKYNKKTKTLAQWQKLGLRRINGKGFPRPSDRAVLRLFTGKNGPAFLMLKNFYTIKRYNNADKYALAVGLLADRIAGYGAMQAKWPRPAGSLDVDEKFEIQERLKQHGLYSADIDGNLGSGSRAAIAAFQTTIGVKADGIPTKTVLKQLRRQ